MGKKESSENSVRIQTSILSRKERQALNWLAAHQPKWVDSDILTFVGFVGALIISAGYFLTNYNINFLWLANLGFLVNWYGDSLDGSLARFRNQQRPVYGYYVDHTMDAVNEAFIFAGVGLSPFMRFDVSCIILIVYLMLTVNVTMNAHLRKEFRLTFAKLGPTEFRIFAIAANIILLFVKPLQEFEMILPWFGDKVFDIHVLDLVGAVVLIILVPIYIITVVNDIRYYASIDPKHKNE